jgi:hypothetical protein
VCVYVCVCVCLCVFVVGNIRPLEGISSSSADQGREFMYTESLTAGILGIQYGFHL